MGLGNSISVVDSSNMSQIHIITTPFLEGTRDISFLNDGQLMIVVSVGNQSILFFSRSDPMSHNYTFIGHQYVSCVQPHGLFHVDDTVFYLSSWHDKHRVLVFEDGQYHSMGRESFVQCLAFRGVLRMAFMCRSTAAIDTGFSMGNIWREDLQQPRNAARLFISIGLRHLRHTDCRQLRSLPIGQECEPNHSHRSKLAMLIQCGWSDERTRSEHFPSSL